MTKITIDIAQKINERYIDLKKFCLTPFEKLFVLCCVVLIVIRNEQARGT